LEGGIECTQRCNCRPRSGKFGDIHGDQDEVNGDMHLQAAIKAVWTISWGLTPNQIGDEIGRRDGTSLGMHLEAEIE
jgi:hypothetical protein